MDTPLFYYAEIEDAQSLWELATMSRPTNLPPLDKALFGLPRPRQNAIASASVFLPMHWTLAWAKPRDGDPEEEAVAELAKVMAGEGGAAELAVSHLVHTAEVCFAVVDTSTVTLPYTRRGVSSFVIALLSPGGEEAVRQWPKQAQREEAFISGTTGGPEVVVEVQWKGRCQLKLASARAAAGPSDADAFHGAHFSLQVNPRPSRQTEPSGSLTFTFASDAECRQVAALLAESIKAHRAGPEDLRLKARIQAPGKPGHVYLKWGATSSIGADGLADIISKRLEELKVAA